MDKTVLEEAVLCYNIPKDGLAPMSGGHFSQVYEFSKEGKEFILRITPPNEEINYRSTSAVLEFMDFLAKHGASVSRPVPPEYGGLLQTIERSGSCYLVMVFEKAKGVLVEELDPSQWSGEFFQQLGRAVGRLHNLATGYTPFDGSSRRPEWDQIGNCYNPGPILDPALAAIRDRREFILSHLRTLPKGPEGYGLIHADLHGGNVLVEAEYSQITFLDFDDCSYGWYGMDIAMNLLDMTVLYPGTDKDDFARRFLKSYLKGYKDETSLSTFWARQIAWFLSLLEIGIYIQLNRDYNPQDHETWVGKFMTGRRQRIESAIPFVDVDFEELS